MKKRIATAVVAVLLFMPAVSQALEPSFAYPINPWKVVQDGGEFGARRGTSQNIIHLGDDILGPVDEPIFSFATGTVKHVGFHSGYGGTVIIEHKLPNNSYAVGVYGHLAMNDMTVSEGDKVSKGQKIGQLGDYSENGRWVPHLHLGVKKGKYSSKWSYWGMTRDEVEINKWYNVDELLKGNYSSTPTIHDHSDPDHDHHEDEVGYADPFANGNIITGPGKGGSSHVRILDENGRPYTELDFLSYNQEAKGGADVAFGDLDNDGKDEIVVGQGPGEKPYINVYKKNEAQTPVASFAAFNESFKGGVRVTIGDIDGNGTKEIIAGAGPGGGPHVRVFDMNGNVVHGKLFPFPKEYRTGVDVAAGDLDGDNKDEIIVSTGPKEEAQVKYYNSDMTLSETTIIPFTNFKGGVHIAAGDIDKDGSDEIIIGAGPGGGPHIRVFEADGTPRGIQFFPFHQDFRGGIDVGSFDYDQDGKDEIVASQFSKGQAWVKVYRYNNEHTILMENIVYRESFEGGTNIAGRQ